MSDVLSKQEIENELENLNGWKYENDKIIREFEFSNFREAVGFIVRLSYEAEDQVHHPEIFNVYNTVRISLNTHDAGNKVTDKDIDLAKAIDAL